MSTLPTVKRYTIGASDGDCTRFDENKGGNICFWEDVEPHLKRLAELEERVNPLSATNPLDMALRVDAEIMAMGRKADAALDARIREAAQMAAQHEINRVRDTVADINRRLRNTEQRVGVMSSRIEALKQGS